MTARQPLVDLPLFPLGGVLFPGGHLPLRIFEPRYLDMVNRCEAEGRPFGVVALIEGAEVRERDPASPGGAFRAERFEAVGTLAHLKRVERPQAGLLTIASRGGSRFRLTASRQLSHGLWLGQAEPLPDDTEVVVPADLTRAAVALQALYDAWAERVPEASLPLQPPLRWADAGWLANRWAELLPLPGVQRQRLMALDNPLLRLELVVDQLDALGKLRE
jgi:uncharacterized protein